MSTSQSQTSNFSLGELYKQSITKTDNSQGFSQFSSYSLKPFSISQPQSSGMDKLTNRERTDFKILLNDKRHGDLVSLLSKINESLNNLTTKFQIVSTT